MGTGYTRNDTSNNIADGNIINASDLDGEFDAIESAMSTSGHTHDGTSAEGGPVTVVGPAQDLVVTATEVKPKTDNTLDLGTSSLQFKNAYFQGTVDTDGIMTAATFEPDGDTAAGDNAAIGYTAAEGLILTGQGSTNDVTIKNDADADVLEIPTGTTNVTIAGNLGVGGTVTGTGTSVFASLDISGDIDVDGITNLDVVDIDGAVDFASTTAHAGNATFADNAKAIFGTGSDLQIYHDGSNSIIADAGTGNIKIQANDFRVTNANASESIITADQDGAANLWYNGSKKLATTNTGIDITGNATFADNGKAVFGAGSDLQIYHDGSNSYIYEVGTGDLVIQTNGAKVGLAKASPFEWMLEANVDGAVTLYYDNATKLATTSTGIDVTGTVTADGLTVDKGSAGTLATFTDGVNSNFVVETASLITTVGNTGGSTALAFKSANTERLRIDSSGNVGIGTSSPAYTIDAASSGNTQIHLKASGQSDGLEIGQLSADGGSAITATNNNYLKFGTNNTERMRIASNGTVGIGTSSPVAKLDVVAGTDERLLFTNSSGTSLISSVNAANTAYNELYLNGLDIRFGTSLTERMRINSSGNVGIGTSSPQATAEISGGLDNRLRINSTDGTTSNNYGIDFSTAGTVRGGIRYNAGNNYLAFYGYDNTERMRINSSGNVGIGTSSPSSNLDVEGVIRLTNTSNSANYGTISDGGGLVINSQNNNPMYFYTGGSEAMRIDGSGNLLVGTTDTTIYDNNSNTTADNGLNLRGDGKLDAARYNGIVLGLNLTGNDGTIVDLRKSGTTVGSIGVLSSNNVYFGSSDSGHAGLVMDGSSIVPLSALSRADNAIDLGEPSYRFDDIYATNGTIQTSDRNEKQDIEELTEAEQRVAVAAKGLLRKFRWKDAVAEKGDEARTHFGIIAQDLQAAFAAEGLDAGDYAMFISSTWTDEETGEERTRMGVRYSELLAFIIAAI